MLVNIINSYTVSIWNKFQHITVMSHSNDGFVVQSSEEYFDEEDNNLYV